jgi:hypothetical protein
MKRAVVLVFIANIAISAPAPNPTPARTPTAERQVKFKELRADFAGELEGYLLDHGTSAHVSTIEGLTIEEEYQNSKPEVRHYRPRIRLVLAWPTMTKSEAWRLMKVKGRSKLLRTDFLRSMGFEQVLLENGLSGPLASGFVYDLTRDEWWRGEQEE